MALIESMSKMGFQVEGDKGKLTIHEGFDFEGDAYKLSHHLREHLANVLFIYAGERVPSWRNVFFGSSWDKIPHRKLEGEFTMDGVAHQVLVRGTDDVVEVDVPTLHRRVCLSSSYWRRVSMEDISFAVGVLKNSTSLNSGLTHQEMVV
ncbi:MAG TPA: hypothetical protein VLE91_00185 [Candidatus Saccharimonadales bacterium]|nr:hypothetical protein [Candidatus Saccharimonadales bacterium]